jgi:hypothetical protein
LILSESDDAIFREVDDEVRQDEYKKLWDKYGKYAGTVAMLFVGAVAAWQGYQYYQQKQAEDASVFYFDALKKASDGKNDDALASLAQVHHIGYSQLAQLQQAAIFAAKGDVEKAVGAYDAFAADAKSDLAMADLARIRAGYLLVDTQSPDQLLTRLGRFDKDDALWHNEAREIFGLSAWRVKDFTMADRYFNAILTDKNSSGAMKQRAEMMVQLVSPNLKK